MSTSANTSEASTPIMTASCPVSLADGTTMLAACKQAILLQGGTWPPDGTRTTSGRSASAATSTTKDDSGFLESVLTASSPDELRRLCDERNKASATPLLNSNHLLPSTGPLGKKWHPISGLSKDQAIRVHRLRKERHELFFWFLENHGNQAHQSWAYNSRKERLLAINFELTELTGLPQYSK